MNKSRSGFTIVELLIVIVVIGILAALVLNTFSGVQTRARNTAAIQEGAAWSKLLKAYQATYGNLPIVAGAYYCLGSGFPVGAGGVSRCRDYTSESSGVLESENSVLMTELSKVGSLPTTTRYPVSGSVGPFLWYYSDVTADVIIVLTGNSASECPQGWDVWWTDNIDRLFCVQKLRFKTVS
jgi:prepilin-type N-terminal cleavage/methylation domain-containing protein